MSREIGPTRRGYDTYEVVSAVQKAVRRGDPDAALYWGIELARSGFGPWLWSRLRTIAVEDCSPEATGLVADLHALNEQWAAEQKGRGDGMLLVARALIALAIAPKNRVATWGLLWHASDDVERREIPDEALDQHTRRGRQMGRGLEHFIASAGLLKPWTGSLDALEAEYREKVRETDANVGTGTPATPPNPWGPGPSGKHAQKSNTDSGQLTLPESEEHR